VTPEGAMGDSRKESKAITLSLEADPLPPAGRGWVVVLVLSLSAAAVVPFLAVDGAFRASAFVGLLAMAVFSVQARRGLMRRARGGRRTSILLDGNGIWRTNGDGDAACVARWDEPFGVTVLANPSKTRALFAFSSAQRTRVVAVRIDSAQAADAARRCLDRAVPVTDADLDDALGGIGRGLSGKSAAQLFAELEKRAAPAIGRVYLFDSGGTQVALEGDKLRARDKVIDLADPLEWRSFTFHEGTLGVGAGAGAGSAGDAPPAAVTLYHATWTRQGPTELVLVCPIPAEASSWGLRSADPPPPRELRVAVDRLFMIPLRKALEAAPRISRAGAPPRKSGSHAILT
jgi:hypothetical protein